MKKYFFILLLTCSSAFADSADFLTKLVVVTNSTQEITGESIVPEILASYFQKTFTTNSIVGPRGNQIDLITTVYPSSPFTFKTIATRSNVVYIRVSGTTNLLNSFKESARAAYVPAIADLASFDQNSAAKLINFVATELGIYPPNGATPQELLAFYIRELGIKPEELKEMIYDHTKSE